MDMDTVHFLTNQHSKTLLGLHREIQKLQSRCSELNFKLHFSDGEEDPRDQLETMECLRAQLEDVTQSLGTELHHKSEIINQLENQLLSAQIEITALSEKQRYSQSELESRSKTIGFLTASLRQVKSRLSQSDSHSAVPEQRRKPLQPISNAVFFSEEDFQSSCFRSLPPSFDPRQSPRLLVPTPPAELPRSRTSYPRYQRRYSAPRLRTNSANESLPLALRTEENTPVPTKTSKKLILPPIPNGTRESQSKNGPMVGHLQSPQTYKHPPKATRSTPVKDS